MDYKEYTTEYQKVILKEQLKRGLPIKQALIDTIKNTDKKDVLEMFLLSNDFEGQIARNDEMAEMLKDDPECEQLFQEDSKTIMELKKTAEDRLKALEEQEKEQDGEEKQNEEEEHDEKVGRSYNEQQNSSTINNEKKNEYNLPFPNNYKRIAMPVYGSEEYYKESIKFNVKSTINSLYQIKTILDSNPHPIILGYLSGNRNVFEDNIRVGIAIQQMPNCDEELKMLSDYMIKESEEIMETVDRYIEQYNEKTNREATNKEQDEQEFEQTIEELEQDELEKDKNTEEQGIEEDNEELEMESDEDEMELNEEEREETFTQRNLWELSPEQKEEIQVNSQQIAQDYNERQANPQPQIEENIVDNSDMSR